jgi:glycosyltransferase involved in cell wall biosynthesis
MTHTANVAIDRSGTAPGAPLVSVVVPAFNVEGYIGDALRSLRAQTVQDIEIIVVDDGSTDGTASVAREHAAQDARIRVISRTNPSGRPSIARNIGLREARGRYIALLDADDTSISARMESGVHAMQRTGALFAFADMQRYFEATKTLAPAGTLATANFRKLAASYLEPIVGDVYLCTENFPAFLLTYVAINTSTVMFDRELLTLEPVWFDESLVCFEDLDLWMRWGEHTRIVFIDQVHVIMRKHAASLTASKPLDTRMDGIAVRRAHLRRLRPRLSREEIAAAERNIGELQFHVAYAHWCAGEGHRARSWFADSWRSRPTAAAALGYLKAFVPRTAVLGLFSGVRAQGNPEG